MPILRLTLTVVGTAAYLGLAILGWGGFAAFFSHPALIALTIALIAILGAALFSDGNLSAGEREDRAEQRRHHCQKSSHHPPALLRAVLDVIRRPVSAGRSSLPRSTSSFPETEGRILRWRAAP